MNKPNMAFTMRFHQHLIKFIQQYKLFNTTETLYVAVSGGIDSMVLLNSLIALKKFGYSNELIVLHINHGTRSGQIQDQKLVKSFCEQKEIKVFCKKLDNLAGSNFENRARDARYEYFHAQALGAKILLGQHINDSLEWTLMQQFKSSNLQSMLGIPVINKNLRRPLMAFSKTQIARYAQCAGISFCDDPTNNSDDFERNRMRKFLSAIKNDYPSVIKNYVHRHNELAAKLNLHAHSRGRMKYKIFYTNGAAHIFTDQKEHDPVELKSVIREAVHKLSGKGRGSLRAQLDRVIQMVNNNKLGPLKVTNGIEIVNYYGHLLVRNPTFSLKSGEELVKRIKLPVDFNFSSYTEFEKVLNEALTNTSLIPSYPIWVIVRPSRWVRCPKTTLSHHAALNEFCKAQGLELISANNLLKQWSKKGNIDKSLSLHFV